jgi:cyclopropane fatty-acyl-phospholipid synthase-like methyltransferase
MVAALLAIIITLTILSIAWSGVAGAPWLPSARHRVRRMLELAAVQPDDVVYDLGSGDGRVLLTAAQDFGARAVGIEIDPLRCLWTQKRLTAQGLDDQTDVIWGNFFNEDLSEADVVTVYLRQDTNNRLMKKLRSELRPGARVVSNTFIFPGWEVETIDREEHLYLYHIRNNTPYPATETTKAVSAADTHRGHRKMDREAQSVPAPPQDES